MKTYVVSLAACLFFPAIQTRWHWQGIGHFEKVGSDSRNYVVARRLFWALTRLINARIFTVR